MVYRFYLDESGHGGDLIGAGGVSEQPFFVLTCIGVGDTAALAACLDGIRDELGLSAGELKAQKLQRKLPLAAERLREFLASQDWPLFLEVVDKRFFLAVHMVEYLLCASTGGHVDVASKNAMAEFLCDFDASPAFDAYLEACRTPEIGRVAVAVDALWGWLETRDEDIARTVQILTMLARDRLRLKTAAAESFLPLAATGATGKPVWILPNLQSFTNIYARINVWSSGGLDRIELIHDTQLQYEGVLSDAKAIMEAMPADTPLPWTPFADYHLAQQASLIFSASDEELCIQAADLLAGFVMRYLRQAATSSRLLPADWQTPFLKLALDGHPIMATGVNFMMTRRDLTRMGVTFYAPHLDLG